MNDINLPPTDTNPLAKPSETDKSAAALEKFLDFDKFGVTQWTTLVETIFITIPISHLELIFFQIKSNNLLSGVRMDNDKGPRPSAYPVVQAPPRLNEFRTYRNPTAYVHSETSYSERTSKYNSQAWGKVSIEASSPLYVPTY